MVQTKALVCSGLSEDMSFVQLESLDLRDPEEKKLVGILDLIEKMQEVDTDSIEPMSHALNITQPLREDKVTEKDIRDKSLSLAPHSEQSLFIVPQVIE